MIAILLATCPYGVDTTTWISSLSEYFYQTWSFMVEFSYLTPETSA